MKNILGIIIVLSLFSVNRINAQDQTVTFSGNIKTTEGIDFAHEIDTIQYDLSLQLVSGGVQVFSDLSSSALNPGEYSISITQDLALWQTVTSYQLVPKLNVNPNNGVSTLDLVRIMRHILGIETFDNIGSYLAADVQGSTGISAFDIVQLRRLILAIETEFPNEKSWMFLPEDFYNQINQPPFSLNIPEVDPIDFTQGTFDYTANNFTVIKIGDVNNTFAN